MKFLSILLLVLCSCVLVSPLQAQQEPVLKSADGVMIELKEPAKHFKEVSNLYTVSKEGTIRLPKLSGEIRAKGITPTALARKIEEAYRKEGVFKAPSVAAYFPMDTDGGPWFVLLVSGAVRKPSEYPLRQGMRLLDVIARAGGMTDEAKSSAVKLIRGEKTSIYDLRKIKEDGSNNPLLQDGDSIIIPSR